jgi:uncharacterized protein (TIGR02453 family)
MTFSGFGQGSQRFLADLAANNNKSWFEKNRGRYERELLDPAAAFVSTLGPRLAEIYPSINFGTQRNGSGSIMRIHRDVRFSPDKSPYKRNLGTIFWMGSGKKVELPCFYLHIDAQRAFFYGGQHMFPKPVIERYRAAVDDEASGAQLVKTLRELERKDLRVFEEPAYKRVPRGYDADHPRGELLRYAGLGVGVDLRAPTLAGPDLPEVCRRFALDARPLVEWLQRING